MAPAAELSVPTLTIPLKIKNISQLGIIWSPTYIVCGIPWKIKVYRNSNVAPGQSHTLGVLLCCEPDKNAWSHAAVSTFKLLSYNKLTAIVERHFEPYVFDSTNPMYGTSKLIEWNNLIDLNKKYVENDTINLEIEIQPEDPQFASKSEIVFERDRKCCCNDNCSSTYRLTVHNIDNFLTVKTPIFKLRNFQWDLHVMKHQENLCLRLHNVKLSKNISCKLQMTPKLISSKVHKVYVTSEHAFNSEGDFQPLINLIAWRDLMDSKNGFIEDECIVVEVEVKISKPDDDTSSSEPAKKQRKLECTICLESFSDQNISSTKCGHLFCSVCITNWMKARKTCPVCKNNLGKNDVFSVFLPFVN